MPVNVSICNRTVTLTYPNKSLIQLEEKLGYSVIGKSEEKQVNAAELVKDAAAWLWAGSLKDPGGALDYDKLIQVLEDATLRELSEFKNKVAEAFKEALPEAKDENPPVPASH